jgi:hypothetical protein
MFKTKTITFPTQDVGAELLDGEFSEEDVELELSVFTHVVRV